VASSTGMRIAVDSAAEDTGPLHTALVAGGDMLPTHPISPELMRAAKALAGRARRVASICTGAFVLAAAGLLNGRHATTHWQHAKTLARAYPTIDVEPDAIFVEDGPFFSSAGVTAGIDLALVLLERDHGAELARAVARSLVVFLQRPGGQSQFSPSLRAPLPRTAPLRVLCDTVVADPAGDYSLASLSAIANISLRHLTRLFRDELSTTPAKYVELIRIGTAKDLLDAGHSVTDTVHRSGFGSAESLRRTFIQHVGISPRAYQQRFRTSCR
jgi:transcriptional regulator GlxA family with amidase domain